MFGLSFTQDRCWKIIVSGHEYFLREYNNEITGYSNELNKIAPDIIRYGGNAYYATGKFAQQQGWIVEQCSRNFKLNEE